MLPHLCLAATAAFNLARWRCTRSVDVLRCWASMHSFEQNDSRGRPVSMLRSQEKKNGCSHSVYLQRARHENTISQINLGRHPVQVQLGRG